MLALSLALMMQAPAVQPLTAADAPRAAQTAVERDSADALERRWLAASPTPEIRLGLAYLALHSYRFARADSLFSALAADRAAGLSAEWSELGLALSAQARGDVARADSLFRVAARGARERKNGVVEREATAGWAAVQARRLAPPGPLPLLARLDSLLIDAPAEWRLRRRCLEGQIRSTLGQSVDIAPLYYAADSAVKQGWLRLGSRCLFTAGSVLAIRGYADSGAAWLGRAAGWQRAVHDRSALAASLQWLGYLELSRGDYSRAGLSLREGIAEGNRTGNLSPVAWAYLTLAKLSLALRDGASAADYLTKAESLFVAQGDQSGVAMLTEVRAVRALQLHDPALARGAVERFHASALGGRGTSPAWSHRSLALLAMQEQRWVVAQAHLDSAAAAAKEHGMAGLAISLLGDNGELALARGDARSAESFLRRALDGANPGQVAFRSSTMIDLAETEAALERPAVAETLALQAMNELERYRASLTDRELRMQVFDLDNGLDPTPGLARVIAALVRAGRTQVALELAERRRARKLLDRLVMASAIGDTAVPSVRRSSWPTWPTIRDGLSAILSDSTAVVEYVRGNPEDPVVVFVATGERLSAAVIDSAPGLGPTLERFLTLLAAGASGSALADVLGRQLLGPVIARLPSGIQRIVVVPDGELHRIPFDALRIDGGWVVARYAVSVAPSVAVLARLTRRRPPATRPVAAFALGDPDLGGRSGPDDSPLRRAFASAGGLPRLRATAGEARQIARYGKHGEAHLGRDASEHRLKSTDLAPFRVIHVGAHAIVDEETVARTGIALSAGGGEDGFVTPSDLANLRLAADLVVLSGCRTAGGVVRGGEGLEGLAFPVIEAGAGAVLATAWPVHDREARRFVSAFYDELAAGKSLGDALRSVKDRARVAGRPPSEWAAFTLIGDAGVTIPLGDPGWPASWWRAAIALVVVAAGIGLYRVRLRSRRIPSWSDR